MNGVLPPTCTMHYAHVHSTQVPTRHPFLGCSPFFFLLPSMCAVSPGSPLGKRQLPTAIIQPPCTIAVPVQVPGTTTKQNQVVSVWRRAIIVVIPSFYADLQRVRFQPKTHQLENERSYTTHHQESHFITTESYRIALLLLVLKDASQAS